MNSYSILIDIKWMDIIYISQCEHYNSAAPQLVKYIPHSHRHSFFKSRCRPLVTYYTPFSPPCFLCVSICSLYHMGKQQKHVVFCFFKLTMRLFLRQDLLQGFSSVPKKQCIWVVASKVDSIILLQPLIVPPNPQ